MHVSTCIHTHTHTHTHTRTHTETHMHTIPSCAASAEPWNARQRTILYMSSFHRLCACSCLCVCVCVCVCVSLKVTEVEAARLGDGDEDIREHMQKADQVERQFYRQNGYKTRFGYAFMVCHTAFSRSAHAHTHRSHSLDVHNGHSQFALVNDNCRPCTMLCPLSGL